MPCTEKIYTVIYEPRYFEPRSGQYRTYTNVAADSAKEAAEMLYRDGDRAALVVDVGGGYTHRFAFSTKIAAVAV